MMTCTSFAGEAARELLVLVLVLVCPLEFLFLVNVGGIHSVHRRGRQLALAPLAHLTERARLKAARPPGWKGVMLAGAEGELLALFTPALAQGPLLACVNKHVANRWVQDQSGSGAVRTRLDGVVHDGLAVRNATDRPVQLSRGVLGLRSPGDAAAAARAQADRSPLGKPIGLLADDMEPNTMRLALVTPPREIAREEGWVAHVDNDVSRHCGTPRAGSWVRAAGLG